MHLGIATITNSHQYEFDFDRQRRLGYEIMVAPILSTHETRDIDSSLRTDIHINISVSQLHWPGPKVPLVYISVSLFECVCVYNIIPIRCVLCD